LKLIVSRQELQAALLFASTDETRYTITGVHVEVDPGDENPRVVATDGRRLCVIKSVCDQKAQDKAQETVRLLLRPDYVRLFVQLSKAVGGPNYPWLQIEHEATAKRVAVHPVGTKSHLFVGDEALLDGDFPDWKKCVPKKSRKRTPVTELGLNAKLIGDFAKAAKYLEAASSIVQMNLVGEEGQIEVHLHGLQNFYGLIMPCRIDEEVEFQPEFLKIIEQLPQPPEKDDNGDTEEDVEQEAAEVVG
jgi:DNA polymerase III sliding clamp (beta) subunit (PCNA family)